jgi:hypothetical protein
MRWEKETIPELVESPGINTGIENIQQFMRQVNAKNRIN